jgi:hypothetical protein
MIFGLLIIVLGLSFAQTNPTDAQVRQHANELGVPYEALRQLVNTYQSRSSPNDIITIDGNQLLREYKENQVRADNSYKGKMLKISASIVRIASGPKITFIDTISGVVVTFNNTESAKIANLSIGQTITFIATVDRGDNYDVYMSNGYLVDN